MTFPMPFAPPAQLTRLAATTVTMQYLSSGATGNVNDDNPATEAASALPAGAGKTNPQEVIIKFDFGSNKTFERIKVRAKSSVAVSAPDGFHFFSSTDDTTLTETPGGVFNATTGYVETTENFSTPITARYMYFAFESAGTGWGGVTVTVSDLNLYQLL